MDLEKLTIGELREISKMVNCDKEVKHPYRIGKNYLIRTVTMIYTGKLVDVYKNELVIEQAAWIPDTARWNECVSKCVFNEVEPYPEDRQVIIGRGSLLDCVEISTLPREVK